MLIPLTRPLVAIDCETDGYGTPEQSRIVELGFKIVYPDEREPKRWVSLINPERPIDPGAIKVHGITDAQMLQCQTCQAAEADCQCPLFKRVPTFAWLAPNLVKGLTDVDYCGYNVTFDVRVLGAEFMRAGVGWALGDARLLDPFELWRVVVKRTLTAAVEEFLGRKITQAHRALGDAEDALDVAMAMLERWTELPRDVSKLHALCFPSTNVDLTGKFTWRDKEVVCNFGKHKGVRLRVMQRGYLEWILNGDFPGDVKQLVRGALAGVYPTRIEGDA